MPDLLALLRDHHLRKRPIALQLFEVSGDRLDLQPRLGRARPRIGFEVNRAARTPEGAARDRRRRRCPERELVCDRRDVERLSLPGALVQPPLRRLERPGAGGSGIGGTPRDPRPNLGPVTQSRSRFIAAKRRKEGPERDLNPQPPPYRGGALASCAIRACERRRAIRPCPGALG